MTEASTAAAAGASARQFKFMFDRRFDLPAPPPPPAPKEKPMRARDLLTPDLAAAAAGDDADIAGLRDAVARLGGVAAAEPEPSYTRAQMDKECAAAFAAGEKIGQEKASAASAAQVKALAEKILAALEAVVKERDAIAASAESVAASVAVAVCKKAFPKWARLHGAGEILDTVNRHARLITSAPAATVRVASTLKYEVEDGLAAALADPAYKGVLTVVGVDDMPPGDCDITWAGGGISRSLSDVMAQVDEAIK
ncbi:hypothetical protein FACS1894186_8320 [Alphaproteobacteria bacterium]|nr:hypothetical protein FACS1894186_8320 [Alphaproteobacteria bacterium]